MICTGNLHRDHYPGYRSISTASVGPGSGTWYRWDNRTRAEDVRCVDIRYMHKHGFLEEKLVVPSQGTNVALSPRLGDSWCCTVIRYEFNVQSKRVEDG